MLKVNVGLSRKLSKDFNSKGFTLNLEGEIPVPLNDPNGVIEKIKEFYDLAEEAIDLQVQRTQGDDEMARRDEEPPPPPPQETRNHYGQTNHRYSNGNGYSQGNGQSHANGNGHAQANGHSNGNGRSDQEPATNKQVQFLLSIGKRQRLSTAQLERKVVDILGHEVGLYDLTKKQAGVVIDVLNGGAATSRAPARA